MSNIWIINTVCKGVEDCGICIAVCPQELYEPSGQMNERGFVPPKVIDESKCIRCLTCMVSCPDMAIVVEQKNDKKGKK